MSVLPGGQPLDRVLPDLDELLDDPLAYLGEAPLAIGPRRMYGLALVFAVPGVALILSCLALGRPDGERIALGVGMLLGAGVWAGWTLLMRGHELVLHPEGVEFVYFDTVVWVPWALFRVEGRTFAPSSDDPRPGLALPIDPKMVPYVQLRRGGVVLAWGRRAAGPQWRYNGPDEALLPARYEVAALDIGELLLVLGQRLGRTPPPGPPPDDAEPAPSSELALDPSGWLTLPLTRLRMPACCARCGGPRDDTIVFLVTRLGDWLIGTPNPPEVRIPVCYPCKELIESRQRRGGYFGWALGAVGCSLAGLALAATWGDGGDGSLWLGSVFGFLVGSALGSTLGQLLSRRPPVRLRRYSPSRGLVSVRFENPEIGARVLASLRARDEAAE